MEIVARLSAIRKYWWWDNNGCTDAMHRVCIRRIASLCASTLMPCRPSRCPYRTTQIGLIIIGGFEPVFAPAFGLHVHAVMSCIIKSFAALLGAGIMGKYHDQQEWKEQNELAHKRRFIPERDLSSFIARINFLGWSTFVSIRIVFFEITFRNSGLMPAELFVQSMCIQCKQHPSAKSL